MLPKSVAVLPCHLGWRTLLKCNKTNDACVSIYGIHTCNVVNVCMYVHIFLHQHIWKYLPSYIHTRYNCI